MINCVGVSWDTKISKPLSQTSYSSTAHELFGDKKASV